MFRMMSKCLLAFAAILGAVALASGTLRSAPQEKALVIPPPSIDETASAATSEVAVLAGGCFWGVQGVYQHTKGVTGAVSGYAGGQKNTAHYEVVGRGGSGHAEAVQVTFDPRQITYGRLLQLFFSVVHDPTQLNRQGPDVGTQYRSAIFPDEPRTGGDRQGVHRAAQSGACLQECDRHQDRTESAVLRGGGLPPGFSHAQSDAPVYRRQRSAQDSGSEAAVS